MSAPAKLKDDQIRAIAQNGGVVQINFYSGFIGSTYSIKEKAFIQQHQTENDSLLQSGIDDWDALVILFQKYPDEEYEIRPPFSLLIEHIEYIINLVGVDYVGLGSDFDGVNSLPRQINDVTAYPLITKALIEKGYSKKDIDKILGGNFLRVLKANELKN